MYWKASAEPTVAAMATARNSAARVRWRPVSAFMVAVIDPGPFAWLLSVGVSDEDIEQNQGSGAGADNRPQALLDELLDRLAVAAQQPGKQQEAGAARNDRKPDEQQEVDTDDTGQDRHHFDRRQMRRARGDQHQDDEANARRDAQ